MKNVLKKFDKFELIEENEKFFLIRSFQSEQIVAYFEEKKGVLTFICLFENIHTDRQVDIVKKCLKKFLILKQI